MKMWRTIDNDSPYWTLKHEAMHGLVRRGNGSELSEWTEHRYMETRVSCDKKI